MDVHNLSGILLDVSIGLLLLCALIRLILVITYFKRNGRREITDTQRRSLRNIITLVAMVSLLTAIASITLMLA